MMMFTHHINVLTHDLKHQCRIADVSHCSTPLDKHGNMAGDPAVVAPYLQGKMLLIIYKSYIISIGVVLNRHVQKVFGFV